ncbi:hypothetical protein D9Q98_002995 [Chlorella vulgaris]|uniref:Uncharacterized protein n=1 Tax=Chlorella vulgaris TaxID=3077 RepID=A0A9D4TUM2_CHLVU|nr:hypothetical protein D9Q98_002995 [Chlorella vulgaris]
MLRGAALHLLLSVSEPGESFQLWRHQWRQQHGEHAGGGGEEEWRLLPPPHVLTTAYHAGPEGGAHASLGRDGTWCRQHGSFSTSACSSSSSSNNNCSSSSF